MFSGNTNVMSKPVYITVIFYAFFILLLSCGSIQPEQQGTRPISHQLLDSLLSKHISIDGKVDYKGIQKDAALLTQYLELLSSNPPNQLYWNKNQALAYWLNTYNAYTIQLILNHYPLKSIKDIGSKIQIPFFNTPWDIKLIEIAGEQYDLNNIEHNILRKNFDEPRIHFAIVCASYSCPKLRSEAYVAERLEEQLTEQARAFLNDPTRNEISENKIKISKIFSWFKGDFTKAGSLIAFLNQYSDVKISKSARVSYMDYNWSLNED